MVGGAAALVAAAHPLLTSRAKGKSEGSSVPASLARLKSRRNEAVPITREELHDCQERARKLMSENALDAIALMVGAEMNGNENDEGTSLKYFAGIRWWGGERCSRCWRDSLYGYIGMEDKTLDPIIRPGSFVQTDPRQRTIPPVKWHDDFDRPIFSFELRERYVCSWCELYGSQLILVPTAHSHANARQIRYPDDATIVGRDTGVAMRIAEMREVFPKTSPAI
jgi:hypothetical protein